MSTTINDLTHKVCTPCEGKSEPFSVEKIKEYLAQVPLWEVDKNNKTIFRNYVMKNYMAALNLINRIALLAEHENHHPDIHLTSYRNLRVELTTHAIGGLSENDFILAAKINELPALEKK